MISSALQSGQPCQQLAFQRRGRRRHTVAAAHPAARQDVQQDAPVERHANGSSVNGSSANGNCHGSSNGNGSHSGKQKARNTSVSERYRPFLEEWDRGFVEAQEEPEGYWMEVVQGEVPQGLRGTLFRNGPGRFKIGNDDVLHPYDGDGLIVSFSFPGDGRAFFRSRFVRTAEFEAESDEERILFRGTFATQRPGGPAKNALDVYVKNTSNTNIVHHGGRLWSLFEAGQPYRLDPATLETQGLESLDGNFRPGLPFDLGSQSANAGFASMARAAQGWAGVGGRLPPELLAAGGDAVTAHPHVDSETGRLVTFSYQVGPSIRSPPLPPYLGTELTFWELDQDFQVAAKTSFSLAGFAFLHDAALTANYHVVFQNPVTVDQLPYLLGRAPAAACVRWVSGRPTLLHLIPRAGKSDEQGRPLQPRCYELPAMFVFHHCNAFEHTGADGSQVLVMDSIHYDTLPAVGREALAEQQIDPDAAFRSRLRRVEVNLQTGAVRINSAFNEYLEMVAINETRWGRRHRYVFGYASQFEEPSIGIAKVDMDANTSQVWLPGFQNFALEPKFVPRPGATEEDDGWLLTPMFHSGKQEFHLAILDAKDLQVGPVAKLRCRQPLPSGLHGCWTGECYAPAEAAAAVENS